MHMTIIYLFYWPLTHNCFIVILYIFYIKNNTHDILFLSSIGRVNADLYALGSDTLNSEGTNREQCQNQSELEQWKQNYVNVLCINSWQVFILLALKLIFEQGTAEILQIHKYLSPFDLIQWVITCK